jgi:hypothetical protein
VYTVKGVRNSICFCVRLLATMMTERPLYSNTWPITHSNSGKKHTHVLYYIVLYGPDDFDLLPLSFRWQNCTVHAVMIRGSMPSKKNSTLTKLWTTHTYLWTHTTYIHRVCRKANDFARVFYPKQFTRLWQFIMLYELCTENRGEHGEEQYKIQTHTVFYSIEL